MAVQRIEWQCPGCQRKFAIPDQQPRPKLCPQCQQARTAQQPVAPSSSVSPGVEGFAEDSSRNPISEGSPQQGTNRRPVKQRRYEVLRTISMWFKVLAGLIASVFVVSLIYLAKMVLETPAGPLRNLMFFQWVVTSVSGITIVLGVYAFAVLLLVAMDIEYNTRDE